ncbi:lipoyl synthase [Candidatus Poribacteria bacterium]|jgi:lipoyl synthase|nr:lipoyl synthase [Candidatus Poribacteria bacterium]MBT5532250.1 lipoyl synthase [Candidatus Poribacteria bacterium]MBT5711852.1 lipoyl synthase [Candidatus Poribacteria bacterium]MBT7097869.1 lipoyl synthase [Candidatus Poribacteria bacterium]MBT7809296.1 lipoyl synthase [Candidatus Poribacteria bacterium]
MGVGGVSNVAFESFVEEAQPLRKPPWIRSGVPSGGAVRELRGLLRDLDLHTVCESANCPNLAECWSHRTATLMLLGDVCTRSCGFCSVTTGRPPQLDSDEPERVADAAHRMGLQHVVLTSVNRDDLPDGGAAIFAETIHATRRRLPDCTIEVLVPDFQGNWDALQRVTDAAPDILNHNVETVPRLYPRVRPQAKFERSLEALHRSKEAGLVTKSGFMLGLGEEAPEVAELMTKLTEISVKILTIGQYLQPTPAHLPVHTYVTPAEFARIAENGRLMGFDHVESGPFVRSSYHAWEHARHVLTPRE